MFDAYSDGVRYQFEYFVAEWAPKVILSASIKSFIFFNDQSIFESIDSFGVFFLLNYHNELSASINWGPLGHKFLEVYFIVQTL